MEELFLDELSTIKISVKMESDPTRKIRILKANFFYETHQNAIVKLINNYIHDKMGGGQLLNSYKKKQLIYGLQNHSQVTVLLAKIRDKYVGLCIYFIGFSTFHAMKLINIHDFFVLSSYRKLGVGTRLLKQVEYEARKKNCCKITLEVRQDNTTAKKMYINEGFAEASNPMLFWSKDLIQE